MLRKEENSEQLVFLKSFLSGLMFALNSLTIQKMEETWRTRIVIKKIDPQP